jgi:gluconolactonase
VSRRKPAAAIAFSLGCLLLASVPADARYRPAPPVTSANTQVVRLDPALDAVLARNTVIRRVATGFDFTEGPMWYLDKLWFSDCRSGNLYTMTASGKVTLVMKNAGGVFAPFPNNQGPEAMEIAPDGTILLEQQGSRSIQDLDPVTLKLTPLVTAYHGKRFNSPNDIVYAPDGTLWFTDPPFGLIGQNTSPDKELTYNGVFSFRKGWLTPAITDLFTPNGIGFSPDGKVLYVSNYEPDMYVREWDVAADDTLSHPRYLIRYPAPHVEEAPDGLKIDSRGNIWTTGPGGIRIITPTGVVLGQIKLPEIAANIAFAGADHRTVYIAASHSIYVLHSLIPGEAPVYYRAHYRP